MLHQQFQRPVIPRHVLLVTLWIALERVSPFGWESSFLPRSNSAAYRRSPAYSGWTMYFDDVSRTNPIMFSSFQPSSSFLPNATTVGEDFSNQKQVALQALLGPTYYSVSDWSSEEVEEKILEWIVANHIVELDENDGQDEAEVRPDHDLVHHYTSVADIVISDAPTIMDALACIWHHVATMLEKPTKKGAILLALPRAQGLWDYARMETLLLGLEFAKQEYAVVDLPRQIANLRLELFHPSYKGSPRLLSPERHAPVPLLGLSYVANDRKTTTQSQDTRLQAGTETQHPRLDAEWNAARIQLEALFAATSASSATNQPDDDMSQEGEQGTTPSLETVMSDAKRWFDKHHAQKESTMNMWDSLADDRWYLWERTDQGSASFYPTVFAAAAGLLPGQSCMIVLPDYYGDRERTLFRLAITINAVLKRLLGDQAVSLEVFHPLSKTPSRRAPQPMLQVFLKKDHA